MLVKSKILSRVVYPYLKRIAVSTQCVFSAHVTLHAWKSKSWHARVNALYGTTHERKGPINMLFCCKAPKTQHVEHCQHSMKPNDLFSFHQPVWQHPQILCLLRFLCKSFHSCISSISYLAEPGNGSCLLIWDWHCFQERTISKNLTCTNIHHIPIHHRFAWVFLYSRMQWLLLLL